MGADPTTLERNGFTDRRVCRFSVLSLVCICIIAQIMKFVKGFFTFFFEPAQDGSLTPLAPISRKGRTQRLKVCTPLPLTMIVYHTLRQIAIGKMHKFGKNNYLLFVQITY